MELDEFHICYLRTGAIRHGNSIACGNGRISCVLVDLTDTAGRQNRCVCVDDIDLTRIGVEIVDAKARAILHQ